MSQIIIRKFSESDVSHLTFFLLRAFAQLDAMLNDYDKKALATGDAIEFRFFLGMWIRSNWIIFRVIIAGGRQFDDDCMCDLFLQEKHVTHTIVIVSGTARGVDTFASKNLTSSGVRVCQGFPIGREILFGS